MEESSDTIRIRQRRFIPLKNPLNNVPNLTEDHFKDLCTHFYKDMEEQCKDEQTKFEKTIEQYRKEIHKMHEEMKSSYKNLFQFMLNHVYDDDKKQLLEAIHLMLEHPQYAEGFAEIIKNTIRFINEGKRPGLIHDSAQYIYGTKPLYFDFEMD